MKIKSIKFNFIVNNIRLLLNLLFPLITFPYVSRILLPLGVGKIAFAQSIINYFMLFASLGIPLYGIREISKVRFDKKELSKKTMEIFTINLIFSVLSFIIFIIFLKNLEVLKNEKNLFLILSLNLVFVSFGVEWFYQGIEQYTYITIRSIVVKIICVVLMFIFIKKSEDYLKWALIGVLGIVGSNVFNAYNLRKYISIELENLNLRRHLKPIFMIFSTMVAISIYSNLDSTMLGILKGNKAVGIYFSAIKINKIITTLATSLGAVMIPRLSYYLAKQEYKSYYKLGNKSITFICFMVFPMMLGLLVLSKDLIILFSGNKFMDSVFPMQIMIPLILILSLSNFTGIQILYPNGKEKIVMYSVIVGAFINFGLNYILIPRYSYNGAAIATITAEIFVLVMQVVLGRRYLTFKVLTINNLKFLFSSIIMFVVISYVKSRIVIENEIILILLITVLGVIIYMLMLILLREKNTKEYYFKLRRKLNV